jgi:hypothetical protein
MPRFKTASEIEEYVSQRMGAYVVNALKTLLESKHLYQNLSIDLTTMSDIQDRVARLESC